MKNVKIFLDTITNVIKFFEDPTGEDCANNVECEIYIDDDRYIFDGEKMLKTIPNENEA